MSAGANHVDRERLKDLFEAACLVPAEARERWLAEACGEQPELRAELESLLVADSRAAGFLESPALASTGAAEALLAAMEPRPAPDLAGRRIGPYRVVRELGRGGMGLVYLAARDDLAFEKLVAVKVVQSSLPAPALLQRFYEERRILAALDHPNIAHLLDAGTTSDGVPYVVMEYVLGRPIDLYCQEHGLATRRRLELFCQVCAAVQYSHQRLVVHRDLKAGNILVTADGEPKLLDFGIAKMLDPGEDQLAVTRTALRALTPECSSPEQVRGEAVTVSSDVYSLGVLLYRLLTDQSPYRSRPRTESEIVRAICEEEPPRPSDVVAAAAGKRHARELRGDLDLITRKALRKEPERRYGSVEQLDRDVERHLQGLPIRAAPDSWRYRSAKFLRRRRLAVFIVATASVAILGGALVSLQQARLARHERMVAQQRFEMVRRLAHAVVFDFDAALESVPGATSARKLVVAKAIEYLDSLSQEEAADRPLLRELASAYLRIGDIQGDPTRPNLGDAAGALDSYNHSLELYRRLAAGDSSPETLSGLAAAHRALGMQSWSKGDGPAARAQFTEMLRLGQALAAADPRKADHKRLMANAYYLLGQVELRQGNRKGATEDYSHAVRLYTPLLAADPADRASERNLALSYMKLGDAAEDSSLPWYRKAASALDALAARPSAPGDIPRLSAVAAIRLAEGLMDTSPAEAESHARRGISRLKPAAEADPANTQTANDLGYAYVVLGAALGAQKRPAEATEAFERSAAIMTALLAKNPEYHEALHILGVARLELGSLALDRHEVTAALGLYQQALPLLEAPAVRSGFGSNLAELYQRLGDAHSARAAAGPAQDRLAARQTAREWYGKSARQWGVIAATRPLAASETAARRTVERKAAP